MNKIYLLNGEKIEDSQRFWKKIINLEGVFIC